MPFAGTIFGPFVQRRRLTAAEPLKNMKESDRWELSQLVSEEMYQLMDRIHHAELLIDVSIDRVMALDPELRVISWNKMCEALAGRTKDEVLGKPVSDVIPEFKSCPVITRAIENALKGLKVFVPAGEGSFGGNYSEQHFIPLKEEGREVEGVLIVIHDVAHRVKAENELKALNKSLARKNRELKQRNAELLSFAHVTGHDLKEPLRKIYTFIEMLVTREEDHLSDEGRSLFKRIQGAVQRMGMLTDDILNFSELSTADKTAEPVDLNHTMKFVLFNLQDQIERKEAEVEVGDLPVIQGYRNLLAQLFQHLLSNSIKFTEKDRMPRIRITSSTCEGAETGHPEALPDQQYVCISIEDNGIGFEKKYAERIFQMFQRLNNSPAYPGTGIGLTLCRKIAELHNGFITVESVPGEGSTFHCYLPA